MKVFKVKTRKRQENGGERAAKFNTDCLIRLHTGERIIKAGILMRMRERALVEISG